METHHSNTLRLLAPAALIVFAIALVLVLATGGGGGGGGTKQSATAEQRDLGPSSGRKPAGGKHTATANKLPQGVYVVKRGDTLGGIAAKTGVPVAHLQELNSGLDQFSLVAGQRIKLR